jgi:hypothetical protein
MPLQPPCTAACQADDRPAYRLAPEAILVPALDGSSRLVDLDGQVYALAPLPSLMLRLTLENGPHAAARAIAERFNVAAERVEADLHTFLAGLACQGVLLAGDQPPRRVGLRARLARRWLSLLIRLTRRLRPSLQGKAAGLLTLSHLCCHRLGWPLTVALWQRLFPVGPAPADPAAVRRAIDDAVRQAVACSPLSHACKERGLASWALARRAGLSPRLTIGLALYPLQAHCWADLDGLPLGDEPTRLHQFQPIRVYNG